MWSSVRVPVLSKQHNSTRPHEFLLPLALGNAENLLFFEPVNTEDEPEGETDGEDRRHCDEYELEELVCQLSWGGVGVNEAHKCDVGGN